MPTLQENTGAALFQGNDRLTLGMVMGVLTFWLFAQSVLNIVPAIQQTVVIPLPSLNLAISLTTLFSGCFIVVAGGIADKLGRVRMTYAGFTLSIAGCLCIIFAQGTSLFALGRVLQGLSGACIMPATLSLIKTCYEGAARQRALSFWSVGSWGGSGLCSLAGGAVATWLGWQWIFVFSIVIALIGMLLIRGTPESKAAPRERQPFDFSGLTAFVLALVALNLIITKGGTFGWLSPVTLVLAAVCLLSAFFFFRIEIGKKQNGFIDFSVFSNRAYSGAVLSNFLLNAAAGTLMVASIYVQRHRGFTAFQSGALTIGYLIAVLMMIRVGEKLLQKAGARKPMLWGTLLAAAGVMMMTMTFLPDARYVTAVLTGYVLLGLGLGCYATPSTDTAIANAPADKIGVASGIYKMASSLGGAFGVAISASVYTALLSSGGALAATTGLLINAAFCLLSMLVIFLLVPRQAMK